MSDYDYVPGDREAKHAPAEPVPHWFLVLYSLLPFIMFGAIIGAMILISWLC